MAVEPHRKLTYDDWLTFPDEPRTELIDGEVSLMPEATLWHQKLLLRLAFLLESYLRVHGGAEVIITPNLRLADHQGYAPDLVVVREVGDDPLTIHGAPDLVVEIVSDARRDLVVKRARYEAHGVAEYWAVLPEADQVQVFRAEGGRFGRPQVYEPPDELSPLVLPAVVVDLAELFSR